MNEIQNYKLDFAKSFLEHTKQDIKSVTKSFFTIGFRLNEAKEQGYVEALGYPDIETLAETEFGFKRSTTYGLMNVYRRFCALNDNYTRMNYIKDEYKDYSYSQLLEIQKLLYIPQPIAHYIPPESSVRDIQEYVKEWRNMSRHKPLPEWKAFNEAMKSRTPQKQLEGQISLDEFTEQAREKAHAAGIPFSDKPFDGAEDDPNPYVYDGSMSVEDFKQMQEELESDTAEPIPSVQTSGLPPCAEPEKPNYNFSTRTGAREFLHDYKNWNPFYGFIGCFFKDMFYYKFKNDMTIYAVTTEMLLGTGEELNAEDKITYFIKYDSLKAKEISQRQFEKFCEKYKDEL